MGDGTHQEPVSTAVKKKRPWFQFHLSTAIVMMLVAAGLLWLNLGPTIRSIEVVLGEPMVEAHARGWPFCFWSTVFVPSGRYKIAFEPEPYTDYVPGMPMPRVRFGMLAADAVIAIAILLAVAALLEWRIRRKERRP
jgi:hypothetical protein